MSRRELREQIFKLLFRIEFNSDEEMKAQCELFFDSPDEVFSPEDEKYIKDKYDQIYSRIEDIDRLINEKAKGWDSDRMGKVELTIIRLGVYEIMYDDDVPESVAINEAVELAKKFGQDKSHGFVNAVLAKFAQ
ncbi:MAG: transcription antitermination factor NusB [Lachnospiraceae bacterium]|nr:transcription antitermination factor NusB [Lachnospiraceae bacterium]MBP5415467.1 transcription antitermination factor NusB [Lachnospiraceae bacterium]MBP5745602.1 transcription antitermination factor NusB [Lachnospiraceae bacterium]